MSVDAEVLHTHPQDAARIPPMLDVGTRPSIRQIGSSESDSEDEDLAAGLERELAARQRSPSILSDEDEISGNGTETRDQMSSSEPDEDDDDDDFVPRPVAAKSRRARPVVEETSGSESGDRQRRKRSSAPIKGSRTLMLLSFADL